MATLGGLSPVSANGQVAVPKAIREKLGLQAGSQVMFRISDSDPSIVEMIPEATLERRYARGEGIGRLERLSRAEASRQESADPNQESRT
jgi:AbrB family looped-hinge helix DNA binding protein